MKHEEEKTEAKRGTGGVQRQTESPEDKIIRETNAEEDQLFAQRGYGGYIDTEKLSAIRAKRAQAIETKSGRSADK